MKERTRGSVVISWSHSDFLGQLCVSEDFASIRNRIMEPCICICHGHKGTPINAKVYADIVQNIQGISKYLENTVSLGVIDLLVLA